MRKTIVVATASLALLGLSACDMSLEEESTGKQSSGEKSDPQAGFIGKPETGKGDAKDGPKNVVGNWQIKNMPKFKRDPFDMFATVKLKVKNVSDSEDEPWLEIRLTRGKTLVTTFDCIGQTVRPGETTILDCESFDDYAKFTEYEIKNAF